MLDEEITDAAPPRSARRAQTRRFVLSATGLAVLLSVAFFPFYFSTVENYDDEGSFLVVLRQFLHHGSLYARTHGPYGPFYFSLAGLIFKLTGHDPTLFSGRLVVLVFTAVSAAMFAATVWRVTRSIAFSLLCEIATYCVLIRVAGKEPMHPGSMIVLLLSVLAFALVSYAMNRRTSSLVVAGAVIGALTMIKVNIGLFAIVAIVVAFVVGNSEFPRVVRVVVAALAVVFPFVLMFQLLYQINTLQFAVVTSLALLASYAPLSVDSVSLPRRALGVMAAGAAAVMALSCIWPLATGTSPRDLFIGVVIQPLGQASNLEQSTPVQFQWIWFLVTACIVYAVLARREAGIPARSPRSWLLDAGLGAAGVSVLAIGIFEGFGSWLPAIAVLPALAWLAASPATVRLAMRFLVPLAILQFLHAYPVTGSQIQWGLVAICVPCTIAMAVAADRLSVWQQATPAMRAVVVVTLGMILAAGGGFSPVTSWHDYSKATPLDLPGARLVRVDPAIVKTYRQLTYVVKKNCDTFYSTPAFDSLYIFTGIPPITGLLANAPGALDTKEQTEVAQQLAAARASGKRVCIVRADDTFPYWSLSSYGKGPLGKAVFFYQRPIAKVGNFSVLVPGPPPAKRRA